MTTKANYTAAELTVAAQRRLERWLLSPELQSHMLRAEDVQNKTTETGLYVAISREAGSGGTEIAHEVGRQLGWDVLDKELLDFMAERYKLPRDMLDVVDEARANWFHDVLGVFLDAQVVSQDRYVAHLERIVHLAALHGNVVFVGRAAQYMLPRHCGLAVRIVAPRQRRVDNLTSRHVIDRSKAVQLLDDLDSARVEFCRRHFHRNPLDPLEYDLVINTARMSVETAAEMIVVAFGRIVRSGPGASGTWAK